MSSAGHRAYGVHGPRDVAFSTRSGGSAAGALAH